VGSKQASSAPWPQRWLYTHTHTQYM
jgi:hypothetical protein